MIEMATLPGMDDGVAQPPAPKASPREALKLAESALRSLEESQAREHRVALAARLAVAAVVILALVGLVVHTFFEARRPQVDSTSVALLAVALIAPFVSRLKALEVGGAKAEWQEGAAVSLKGIVQLVGMQQAAIGQLFDDVAARAATGPETTAPAAAGEPHPQPPWTAPRPLRRVVWVNDHPQKNAYELQTLGQILEVVMATTNEQAFDILAQGEIDAVISDVGRDYDLPGEPPGGVRLLGELRERFRDRCPPVLYYTSSWSIQRYGADLEANGALAVSTLFSDLLRALRQIEQQALESIALAEAARVGTARPSGTSGEPDVVVELANGNVVGIEIASWLQRPQMAAFADRLSRLAQAMDRGLISQGFLLARPEVLDDRRRAWAEERRIEIVGAADLAAVLDRLATG